MISTSPSYLVFDTEASGAQRNKANPFDSLNKLMCISWSTSPPKVSDNVKIEYDDSPYGQSLVEFQKLVDDANLLIGFNLKYDLHWVRRYGIKTNQKRLWDCQCFYFIDTHQKNRFPSLDDVCVAYDLPKKIDVVKEEYWNCGLDTNEVPWDILDEYARYDAELTEQVYLKQLEIYKKEWTFERKQLFSLMMQDLHVLEDMEWNGMMYDEQKSIKNGEEILKKLKEISDEINSYSVIPIAINSGDDLSAFLYGGKVKRKERIKYQVTLKGGVEKEKEKWGEVWYTLPRLFEPIIGSEVAKDGYYQTNKDILLKVHAQTRDKARRHIIDILLSYAKLEKRQGTYFYGIPKKMREKGWPRNELHGSLNQCVTVTGRLSSDSPNLQNIDGECKFLFYSRYNFNKGNKCLPS